MASLVFKRRKRKVVECDGQTVVKISNRNYKKVWEISDETGLSLKEVIDKLVEYACENIEYKEEDETA